MNNKSVNPNNLFEELVESYITGSITEEQSKELLEMLQSDESKRREFGTQLQLSQLLAIKESRKTLSADQKIMELLTASPASDSQKQPRPINWNRALVRIAAVLMVMVGISYVVKLNFEDQVMTEKQFAPQSAVALKKPLSEKHDLSLVEARKERSDLSAAVDSPELKKDMDSLINKEMNGRVESSSSADELVNLPMSSKPQKPQAFDAVMNVKSPVILKNIYSSTRNAGTRAGGANRMTDAEQSGYDYKREDLEVEEVALGEAVKQKSLGLSNEAQKSRALTRDNMMPPIWPPRPPKVSSGESYAKIEENKFLNSSEKPLSTFSIDVDTASYSNMRRMLNNNQLPPVDAIRIEEMINYFEYNYEGPGADQPFSSAMALHPCPWNLNHKLLRVGLQGRKMDESNRKPSNLVFLLDVSGSMNSADKLPLLKTGMTMLVNALSENDRVAIVVYAGSSGLVLDSTSAADKGRIIQAMERLSAGGSTAGGAGIELAYKVCADNFIKGGVNRVILATDGDFNVGTSSHNGLQSLIEQKRSSGIFLSVLGFGIGNLQDSKMELLANKGNGNYFYIDSEREAEKVLVKQLNATLETIAKDVKIQIEFNPEHIKSYRLIGYVNRKMAARDFANDKKDAGEIGSGHQVTALYELIPVGAPDAHEGIPLKYGKKSEKVVEPQSNEMLTLKLRYKAPDADVSKLLTFPLTTENDQKGSGDNSFRWAAAVAAFGQMMRDSQYTGEFSVNNVRELALEAKGEDSSGYRAELINLIDKAARIKADQPGTNDKGYPVWQYRN
ncbi:MAG: von Willebrand factor type A domain-containing protein [Kiritimatiellae bacterium]|jgi:Ca-activated chloride channel family protein|nr:von Willebrand factor type A domain-containing protein [Kiritimatiellia bacterium]